MCDKEEFKKRANFFIYFYEQLIREPIDFNLIMLWNFIGFKLSDSLGLTISSFIRLISNILILFLTYNIYYDEYDKETCQYNFLMIVLLFFNWALMAISFGASSLLTQQNFIYYYSLLDKIEDDDDDESGYQNIEMIEPSNSLHKEKNINEDLTDSNNKIQLNEEENRINNKKKEKQKEEKKSKNLETLILFCFSCLLGFSGKYGISYLFSYYPGINIDIYYEKFSNDTQKINFKNDNYIFFSNNSDINENIINFDSYKDVYFYLCLVYTGSIILSTILLYSLLIRIFFVDKKRSEDCCDCSCQCNCCVWKIVCEICGCIIYFERIILNDKKENNDNSCCKSCWKKCIESLNNYCNNIICNMYNCRKEYEKNACECCTEFNEDDFDKEKQCFCYCFQIKGFGYWFNKFFINKEQREIIFCMVLYFISKLSTIGNENQYELIFENNGISQEIKAYLINLGMIFGVLLIIFLPLYFVIDCCCEELDSKKNKEFYSYLYRFIVLSVIIFISLSIILSGFALSIIFLFVGYKEVIWTSDITLVEKVNLYSVIILNALYSLFINYYCLIIAKNKIENEFIFSQTILVSAYSILIDFFIYLIKLIFQQNVKNLYIFQLILAIIFSLPISLFFLKYFFYLYYFCVAQKDQLNIIKENVIAIYAVAMKIIHAIIIPVVQNAQNVI